MRKKVTISVPASLHDYMIERSRYGTVSEYVRRLVRLDQQRQAEDAGRPVPSIDRANDSILEALDQIERLKAIVERQAVADEDRALYP